MIRKRIIINIIWQSYYSKIDHRLRYLEVKDFSNELNCKKSLNLIQYLEDDILNYSSNVMFRGTPCNRIHNLKKYLISTTTLGWKDIGIRQSKFVIRTKFLYSEIQKTLEWISPFSYENFYTRIYIGFHTYFVRLFRSNLMFWR